MTMSLTRRRFLKISAGGIAWVTALLKSHPLLANWPAASFIPGAFDQTLKQVLNGKPIVETDKVNLDIPEIAENGALVPITVASSLTDVKAISIIVEQNPVPLALQAILMPELQAFISARLKIASSSFVFVIVEGEKVCYSVKKKVKVTIGGCGG